MTKLTEDQIMTVSQSLNQSAEFTALKLNANEDAIARIIISGIATFHMGLCKNYPDMTVKEVMEAGLELSRRAGGGSKSDVENILKQMQRSVQ